MVKVASVENSISLPGEIVLATKAIHEITRSRNESIRVISWIVLIPAEESTKALANSISPKRGANQ